MPQAIIGLGNPGERYAKTRHNAGFLVIDELARRWQLGFKPGKGSYVYAKNTNPDALLMKPATYMNMMNPTTWAKWADFDSYEVLTKPQTYAYWAQPGAYGHLVNIDFYTERFNPLAYGEMMNAALGNFGFGLTDVTDALRLSALLGVDEVATVETAPVAAIEN